MTQTVLVTGGTGYIGSWICQYLLDEGYTVRVAVRNKAKKDRYAHLEAMATGSKGTIEFWEADLLKEGSYDAAAVGCSVVYHVASPFILNKKDPQKELIDPALIGTRNVLNAATRSSTVQKVVLTSSVAAIYGDAADMTTQGLKAFTEAQWNTTSSLEHQPYSYSKLLAEQAAWEIANPQKQWKLVVLNPSFVMGPSLTTATDSESFKLMKDFLSGKFATGVPDIWFGFVDVRDVAKAHLLAAQHPNAEGRHILCNEVHTMLELGQSIKKASGKSFGLPFMTAPKWVIRSIGFLFGITRKFVDLNVGYPLQFDNTKSKKELGVQYRPFDETIGDMVRAMQNR